MKTADERSAAALLLNKYMDAINRVKAVAATLASKYGYGSTRSPTDVATDLEDIIATELEIARSSGEMMGYNRGVGDELRNRKTKESSPFSYVPSKSATWPLIDLLNHNNDPGTLRHERDTLAVAIAEAALKGGVYNGEVMIGGPALLTLAKDMGEALAERHEAGRPVVFESDPVSAKVHVLAKGWAAIPIAVRAMFTQAMWDGVSAKLAKMPSVDSDKASALNMAYMAAVEIIHAVADLGGAAVSTAPDELTIATAAPINPYAGIVKFNDAWSPLPAEWAAFPAELRQAIIDGLFTWMRNVTAYDDPRVWNEQQLNRACQVAEDLLDAAKHLGNGVVPQGVVFKDDVAVEVMSKPIATEDKSAPRVRKVSSKRGPMSRLESIAWDLRMASDALIELDGEAREGDSYVDTVTVHDEPTAFKGILASVGDASLVVGDKQFTCPDCGSHFFGSSVSTVRDGLVRRCQGGNGCKRAWHESDDAKYMKPTGTFTSWGGSNQASEVVIDIGALADRLLASLPERAASNRVLCFEQIQGGIRGVVGHALPGIADIRPWTSFVGDTIAECIENIAALREVK